MRRRAFHNHLLDHKSPKRKRYLGTMAVVDERDADNVALMLPYAG
jgi:large subunit ribosomal protein L35